MFTAQRYHDISCGHRVHGHESKCSHLHGHNYRIHFKVAADNSRLDELGRVLDFSVIKHCLCMWVEENWDHKFLAWHEDPIINGIYFALPGNVTFQQASIFQGSIVFVPFNPTAENMADYLLMVVGPQQLPEGFKLIEVTVEETMKCSATSILES